MKPSRLLAIISAVRETRLPAQPLVDICRVRADLTPDKFGPTVIGDMLGVNRRQVYRWIHGDHQAPPGLTLIAADKAAIALAEHPIAIWGFAAWAQDLHPEEAAA